LFQKMNRRQIDERMHRVQAKAVDVIVAQPHERVIDKKAPDLVAARSVEIDGRPPRRVIAIRNVRPKSVQVIPGRSEVVIDDVENHGETAMVTGIDES